MNPWQFLRREVGGAVRSMRYDLVNRRAPRGSTEATVELPLVGRPVPELQKRRKAILVTSGVLAIAGAAGGYQAIASGLDALIGGNGSPEALPPTGPRPGRTPSPGASDVPGSDAAVRVPVAHSSTLAPPPPPQQTGRPTPTGTPPVPTPAPTCSCPTPTPTPTVTPSPSATPSPSPAPTQTSTGSTQPTISPTSTATQ